MFSFLCIDVFSFLFYVTGGDFRIILSGTLQGMFLKWFMALGCSFVAIIYRWSDSARSFTFSNASQRELLFCVLLIYFFSVWNSKLEQTFKVDSFHCVIRLKKHTKLPPFVSSTAWQQPNPEGCTNGREGATSLQAVFGISTSPRKR